VSNFKRGVVCDPALGDSINVTIVATGLNLSSLPQVFLHKENPTEVVVLGDDPYPDPGSRTQPLNPPKPHGEFGIGSDDRFFYVQDPFTSRGIAGKPTVTKKGKPALILDPGEKITDFETIPAYVRQRIKIQEESPSDTEVSALKIEEWDGKQRLSSDNSYIHQTQD